MIAQLLMGGRRKAYVMIITGQSNAGSHGENLSALFTIDATKVHHYDADDSAFVDYNSGVLVQNGYETQAAGLQSALRGDNIVYVIRVSQGSLAISNWDSPDGIMWTPLEEAVTTGFAWLRSQGFKPVPLSTLWVQGEQDAVVGTSLATYQSKLQTFINNLQALDETLANTQFVCVKLTEGSGGGGYDPSGIANVNGAMEAVYGDNAFVEIITPEDIGVVLSDTVHYTTASYILLGEAWSALI